MKRIICIFALALAFLLFSVPCFADMNGDAEGQTEQMPASDAEGSDAPIGQSDENFFAVLYDAFTEHASELFSAVACASSLLIVFSYKKGFLPLVAGAFEKLSLRVKDLGDEAEKQSRTSESLAGAILPKLEQAETALRDHSAQLSAYAEKLPSIEKEQGERALLRAVLSEQIDLLSDIFMASSLPEYRKSAIGERVAAMKAQIAAGGDGNDETV